MNEDRENIKMLFNDILNIVVYVKEYSSMIL